MDNNIIITIFYLLTLHDHISLLNLGVLNSRSRLHTLRLILRHQLRRLILLPLNLIRSLLTALVLITSHLLQMNLIGSISQPQRTDTSPHVSQRRILADTSTTERLHSTVNDSEGSLRDEDLGLGNFRQGLLGAVLVHLDGGVEDNEAGGINLDAGLGDPLEDDAVFAEELAEGLLAVVVDAHEHPVEGTFRLFQLV